MLWMYEIIPYNGHRGKLYMGCPIVLKLGMIEVFPENALYLIQESHPFTGLMNHFQP